MTPDERQLIIGLFDRLRAAGPQDKDREAEALIMQLVRQTPDGVYLLVQTALVQDYELQGAQQRIDELERSLAGRTTPSGSGSFLGRTSAVPAAAPQPAPAAPQPWGTASAGFSGRGPAAPQPSAPQPMPMMSPPPAAAQPARGGFFKGALAAAAGVAGGVLLANSLGNMFGGNSANAGTPEGGSGGGGESTGLLGQSGDSNDPGNYDAGGGGDQGGDSWGSSDSDIEI